MARPPCSRAEPRYVDHYRADLAAVAVAIPSKTELEFALVFAVGLRVHRFLLADQPPALASNFEIAQAALRACGRAGFGRSLDSLSLRGILELVLDPRLWIEEQLRPDF